MKLPNIPMQDSECAKAILEIVPPTIRYIRNEMRLSAKSELTIPQFRILAKLSKGIATNSELAEWMGVSAPTMTRMIDPLFKRNLVSKKSEPNDRRQIKLMLTESGQALHSKIYKVVHLKFTKIVSELSTEKKKMMVNGLYILRETFL